MDQLELLQSQYDNLEKMYLNDTKELRKQIEKLEKECDQWRAMAEQASINRAEYNRKLRRV